jgi:hypothetical protein
MEFGARDYYVKLDNVLSTNPDHAGYKCISAHSGYELLERACSRFCIQTDSFSIQLWAAGTFLCPVRIDTLASIPLEYEFIYLRISPRPHAQQTIV